MDAQMDPRLVRTLLQYERQAQVGRLLRGLVHNLSGAVQMVRLPVDLLEIQLQKQDAKIDFAFTSIQEGLNKVFGELELLSAKCSQILDAEPRVLNLVSLVQEQLDFWPADLFFKHDVKHEFQHEAPALKTHGAYCDLALAFNAMLGMILEGLRDKQERDILIKMWSKGGRILIWVGDHNPTSSGTAAGLEPFPEPDGSENTGLSRFLIRQAVKPWDGDLLHPPQPSSGLILSLPKADMEG